MKAQPTVARASSMASALVSYHYSRNPFPIPRVALTGYATSSQTTSQLPRKMAIFNLFRFEKMMFIYDGFLDCSPRNKW